MNIQELIAKVDKIKEDFDVINDRIMEFTASTDKEILDFDLIKIFHSKLAEQKKQMEEYITSMRELALNPTTEINHAWHINLFQTRLAILTNNISSTLDKIKDLEKYRTIDPELKYSEVTTYFLNSENMEQMREKLKTLDNLYKVYKENQKIYKIKLNLDDKVETEIEKQSDDMYLNMEGKYLIWANSSFKLLKKLQEIYEKDWKETSKVYKNNVNQAMIDKYNWEYIQNLEMEDNYILWLNIEEDTIWEHLGKLEKTINKYWYNLQLLTTIYNSLWKENMNSLYKKTKKLWLENILILDKNILSSLDKQLSQKHNNLEDLVQAILSVDSLVNLNKYIKYNELVEKVIREYEQLKVSKEKKWKVESMNFSSIVELLSSSFNSSSKVSLLGEIKKSSNNIKTAIIKELKNSNIDQAIGVLESNIVKITSIKTSLLEAMKTIATFIYKKDGKKATIAKIKKLIDDNKYIKNKTSINSYLKIIFNGQYRIKKEDSEKKIKYKSYVSSSSSSSSKPRKSSSSSSRSSPSSRSSSSSRSGSSSSRSSSSSSSSYSSSGSSSR